MCREGIKVLGVIFFMCAFYSTVSAQQTIRGKVVDKQTQAPIIGATVILENTAPLKGDDTNRDGEFRIQHVKPDRYTIRVSYLGYKDELLLGVIVGSGQEVVLTIEITEAPTSMDEIIVGVDRVNPTPINEMAQISGRSFTVDETKRFSASGGDPLRLASSFAGVIATGDSDNEIIVRGNSSRGILWMLEGIEIPSPNHFSNEGASSGGISMFSTQVISRSDFLTGAFPAKYGNATSGVFDIHLRNGNNEQRETTLQFGVLGIDTSIEGPINNSKASYLFNYRYSTLAIFSAIGMNIIGENEENTFQDLSFKVHAPTGKKGTFSLFGLGGLSKNTYSYTFRSGEKESSIFGFNMGVIGLSHKYLINNTTSINTTVSVSGTKAEDTEQYPAYGGTYGNELNFLRTYVRGAIHLNKKFSSKLFVTNGITLSKLNYNFEAVDNTSPTIRTILFDDQGDSHSVNAFTSWKYQLSSRISLVNGLHYTFFALNGESIIEPRSSIKYIVSSQTSAFIGFGQHSKIESLEYYLGNVMDEDGSTKKSNKNLELSRSNHYVAGFDISLKKQTYFKTEIYYQYLYNIPILKNINGIDPSDIELAFSTINLSEGYLAKELKNGGTGENYGVEVTLEQKFLGDSYFLINATIYDSKYTGSDGLNRDSRYNGTFAYNILAGKEYVIGNKKDRILGLNLKVSHAGNKRYTPISIPESLSQGKEVRLLKDAYSRRYPNYFRMDVQLTIRRNVNVSKTTTEFRLDIQNFTNRNNPVVDYLNFNSYKVEFEDQLGILPFMSYRIEF